MPPHDSHASEERALQRLRGEHSSHRNLVTHTGSLLQSQLRPLAERAGAANVRELLGMLRQPRQTFLNRAVAEAITIKETSFFRDVVPFDLLREHLIPELLERRRATRSLRLWSAACATGQEAWSVAMLLHDEFPQLAGWNVQILGTDISQTACAYASEATYTELEVSRGLSPRALHRHFRKEGAGWTIREELKRGVRFERANLCGSLAALPRFDLVLIRNVLLYFSPPDRTQVLRNVHAHMQPDGAMLLGNAEQAEDSCDLFRVEFGRSCFAYRPLPQG